MQLFKAPPALEFEKTAVPLTKLTAATDRWPEVILGALTQQVPSIVDYQLSVHITKLDGSQGYGFGYVAARSPTDKTLVQQVARPVPHARVPFLIKDFNLLPFDLFMRGDRVYPLTEKRLKEALFSTDTFDVAAKGPGGVSIAGDLYPPSGGGSQGAGKYASPVFLCQALSHFFVDEADLQKVAEVLDDPDVAWHVQNHEAVGPLLAAIVDSRQEKTAGIDPVASAKPDVVQVSKLANGKYRVKAASSAVFQIQESDVDAPTARKMVGDEAFGKLAYGDEYTIVIDPVVTEDAVREKAAEVDSSGSWAVRAGNRDARADAYTDVRDLDGSKLSHVLLVGKSGYAFQTKVAGVKLGEGNLVPSGSARLEGTGFLVNPETGSASIPFEVTGVSDVEGRPEINVKTASGERAILEPTEGLKGFAKLAKGRYAVPSSFLFRKLAGSSVELAKSARSFEKAAEVENYRNTVEIVGDRTGVYTLRSPMLTHMDKAAYKRVKSAQAIFILGGLGVEPEYARRKLAHARVHGPVTLRGCRPIKLASQVGKEIKEGLEKMASSAKDLFDTRVCLVKEALEIDEADTADKILGLNFLRPENVSLYIAYLPDLERAVFQLGDLLLATRVGLKPLSEEAVRKALFALEETVQQLKIVAQTQSGTGMAA